MYQFKVQTIQPLKGVLTSLLLLPFLVLCFESKAAEYSALTQEQLIWLSQRIYSNECGGQADCLTSWNAGEDFPSLGIGHFIWYQAEQEERFTESFPALVHYLESRRIQIPTWISEAAYDSPWQNRQQFLEDINKPRLVELRRFLEQEMPAQTQFIINRFELALEKIITASASSDKTILEEKFYSVANTSVPYGLYALIDYVNFKGEGISEQEQYKNQGWGLKQVLENMGLENHTPLQQFVIAAQTTLETRVTNAPVERNEERWLRGWKNRINTYLPATTLVLPETILEQ